MYGYQAVSTLRADPGLPLPGELSDTAAAPSHGAVAAFHTRAMFLVGGTWHTSERLPRWNREPQTWIFECKLCRARFSYRSYCWPCCAKTPPHDTFHEVTARRIDCLGSRCIGVCWAAVLGLAGQSGLNLAVRGQTSGMFVLRLFALMTMAFTIGLAIVTAFMNTPPRSR
jgi:hypothetical protein